MKRLLPLLILPLCLHAKELEGVRAPAAGECPTVEEAAAKMKVPEGYEVRCFASEPMVVNPVAMTFDERGRLWVVELYEYPSGAKQAPVYSKLATDSEFRPVDREAGSRAPGDGKPRDRVKVLEDRDNDGIADKVTVFVEGLNLATGILIGHGGVYVGQAPNLLFFRDTNGDDVADEWKTVLTGFGLEDRHELLNGFTWGPDGWMYFTHGVFTHSKVRKPGAPASEGVKLDAGVGRVKPLTGEFEVFADGTSNPWGVDFDAQGNAFVSACVIDHLFHLAPAGLYHRQGGTPEFPYAYGLLPSIVKHKHFRAAYAGVQVYQGWAYPEEMRGRILMGNIHDNAVHEEKLTPVGSTFRSEPVRDFLRAENGWFRPVSTQIGPDDNVWVMDWCDKYPCYQNAQANPEGVDRERGRIWRVVYTGGKPGAPVPSRLEDNLNLAAKDSASLFFLLQGKAHWMGSTARRLLAERGEAFLAPMLTNFVEHMRDNPARLPALWTLVASGVAPSPEFSAKLAGDADPAVRLWTARWIGERRLEGGVPTLVKLASDPDPAVRLAVAASCRQFSGGQLTRNAATASVAPVELAATAALMRSSGTADPTLAHVIWMALQPRLADPATRALCLEKLAALPESAKPLSEDLVTKAVRMLCDRRDAETLDAVFRWTQGLSDPWVQGKALEALVMVQEAGVRKPGVDAGPSLAAWRDSDNPRLRDAAKRLAVLWGDPVAVAALVEQLGDAKTDVAARREALGTLRKLKAEAARPALLRLVREPAPEGLRVEAVRFLADLGGDDARDLLLSGWKDFPPPVRLAAADALVSRENWASALLDAVPVSIRAEDLPMTVRRFFGTTRSPLLVERAKARIGVWRESDEDTRRLIAAKRKAVLEGKPDLVRGRQLFETTCATCHPFLGKGQLVGPDLTGSGRSNLDALLSNLIDPNQIIGRGYENMLVRTKDGRTLGGRIVENTPGQVKLLNIGGAEQIVARDQIESIEDTGLSLMPAGFGQLPDDVLRDLVWFVLAPPEEGELTAAKREELVKGVDSRPTEPKAASASGKRLDWESAALWNPDWKIDAESFEDTPTVIAEHHDRRNVLMLHPKERGVASALERTMALPADRALRLRAVVSSRKGHDWDLRIVADGKELKRVTVDHRNGAWTTVEVTLDEFKGKTVRLRLENVPTDWSWEFSYWGEVKVE